MLDLLGVDRERLTARDMRLTDMCGEPVRKILT